MWKIRRKKKVDFFFLISNQVLRSTQFQPPCWSTYQDIRIRQCPPPFHEGGTKTLCKFAFFSDNSSVLDHRYRPIERRYIHRYLPRTAEDDHAFEVPFHAFGMHVMTKSVRTPSKRLATCKGAANCRKDGDADLCLTKIGNSKNSTLIWSVGQKWDINASNRQGLE